MSFLKNLCIFLLIKYFPLEKIELTVWLNFYRYISLLAISIIFLAGPPMLPLHLKVALIFALLLEAFFFTRAYSGEKPSLFWKKFLIFGEISATALLAAFTGGFGSPFLWYAVNPLLLATTFSPVYFGGGMLIFFFVVTIFLQNFGLFGAAAPSPLWPGYADRLLFFILATSVGLFFSHLFRKLSQKARSMEQKIQQIKSLYEAMEVISHHTDPQEIVSLFASYGRALTGAKKVILWIQTQFGYHTSIQQNYYAVRGPRETLSEESWFPYLKRIFEEKEGGRDLEIQEFPSSEDYPGGELFTVKVRSSSRFFGLLSAFYQGRKEDLFEEKHTLAFLADLCAIALEKCSQDALWEEFLLMEEKDRIASEIHDNVTQNIFGLIYGLETLLKKESLSEQVREHLRLMQKTAQRSLRDLRASIYRISSRKNKMEPFIEEMKKYLFDLGQLNSVSITFDCQGDVNPISSLVRKSLYRILKEATGNAIRHGGCSTLTVIFKADSEKLSLTIADNGCGFETHLFDYGGERGLGLLNMKELARNMGGVLTIKSAPGKGTTVCCEVPRGYGRISAEKEGLIL